MGNNENRTSFHKTVHPLLHHFFGTRVNRGCRLVKDKNRCIGKGSTRNGDKLTLPVRQACTVICQNSVIPIIQVLHKGIHVSNTGSFKNFLACRIGTAIGNIFSDSPCEEMGILKHDTKRATKRIFLNQLDINTIISNHTRLDIVETVNQVGNRRLTSTCRTDKGNLLPLVCIEINVMKDLFLTIVREINVLEDHISDQLDQFVVAIWTWVFPSPEIGFLVCHNHLTIYQFVVDQSDLTLVNFFWLIQEVKDTVSTCKCHKNKVQLLRDLSNRTVEGTVQL